jgi:hypothetical protein
MVLFCAIAAGLSIAAGNYGLFALNVLCIFLNFNSYKTISAMLIQRGDN